MSSAALAFVKMQGVGNDFVVLDALSQPFAPDFDFALAASELCRRRWSIGGDGLLLLDVPDDAAKHAGATVRMRMWNPDGSEDMCGNGLRCIAALAHRRGYAPRDFTVQTLASLRQVSILENSSVRAAMGEPQFERSLIPLDAPCENFTSSTGLNYTLPLGDRLIHHVNSLSTGSTHTVIFGEHPNESDFQRLSPLIENHPWFPQRTSVLWANIVGENHLNLRIWERGVGETLACGTGACAAAVAFIMRHGEPKVRVESKGGVLTVEWRRGAEIFLTGPAQIVCEGTLAR